MGGWGAEVRQVNHGLWKSYSRWTVHVQDASSGQRPPNCDQSESLGSWDQTVPTLWRKKIDLRGEKCGRQHSLQDQASLALFQMQCWLLIPRACTFFRTLLPDLEMLGQLCPSPRDSLLLKSFNASEYALASRWAAFVRSLTLQGAHGIQLGLES